MLFLIISKLFLRSYISGVYKIVHACVAKIDGISPVFPGTLLDAGRTECLSGDSTANSKKARMK